MLLCRPFLFLLVALHCLFPDNLGAAARNPPPVFETDYTLPETVSPDPLFPVTLKNTPFSIDVNFTVVLCIIFLLLAGFAVHRWRSRKILFLLAVCSVTVFGFLLQGCLCPIGSFQNLTLAFVDPSAVVPWTAVFLFIIPLIATLFWGRIFCSSVCPLGAIQELTAIKNWRISDRWEHILGLFRFFWLGIGIFCVVVGFGFVVCRFDPYIGFFRLGAPYSLLIFSGILLILGIFVGRPFCRFLCPYGALLGVCSSLAAQKVAITPGRCDQCKLCEHVCPYNAILSPQPEATPQERRTGPLKLAIAILALPLVTATFAFTGYMIAPRLAVLHRDIQTARLLYAEEEKWIATSGSSSETRGLAQIGTPSEDVYQKVMDSSRTFRIAGIALGCWIGLIIGIKWITLTLRYRRTEYEVDPARCFACGRCFWYCPNQKENRLLLMKENS